MSVGGSWGPEAAWPVSCPDAASKALESSLIFLIHPAFHLKDHQQTNVTASYHLKIQAGD